MREKTHTGVLLGDKKYAQKKRENNNNEEEEEEEEEEDGSDDDDGGVGGARERDRPPEWDDETKIARRVFLGGYYRLRVWGRLLSCRFRMSTPHVFGISEKRTAQKSARFDARTASAKREEWRGRNIGIRIVETTLERERARNEKESWRCFCPRDLFVCTEHSRSSKIGSAETRADVVGNDVCCRLSIRRGSDERNFCIE